MKRSGEEILADIDATLDQLIQNADALQQTSVEALQDNEVEALQKTQESLLARILDRQVLLKEETKLKPDAYQNIQQKIAAFGKLNARLILDVAHRFGEKPRIGRNRKKQALKVR